MRISGMVERRPKASRIASGNASTRPNSDSSSVTGRPLQRLVGTAGRPKMPPAIRISRIGTVAAQA